MRRARDIVGQVDGRAVRCAELRDGRPAGGQQPPRGDAECGAAVTGGRVDDVRVADAAVREDRHRLRQQHRADERRGEVGDLVDQVGARGPQRSRTERREHRTGMRQLAGADDHRGGLVVSEVDPDGHTSARGQPHHLGDLIGREDQPRQPNDLVRDLMRQQGAVHVEGVEHREPFAGEASASKLGVQTLGRMAPRDQTQIGAILVACS